MAQSSLPGISTVVLGALAASTAQLARAGQGAQGGQAQVRGQEMVGKNVVENVGESHGVS